MSLAGNRDVRAGSALVDRLQAASRRPANLGLVPDGTVSLAMGEPFAETPEPVVEAAARALRAGRTRYAPLTGSPSLREAVAAHLTRTTGAPLVAEQVVLTHGASAGLAAAILATVDPGDRVVIPEPSYSLYADHVAMAGGQVVWVANRPDGRLDLDALVRSMPGARLLVLCNPSNPTGRVIPRADLEAVAGFARECGTLLLSDEAYSDIVFDGLDFHSSLQLADNHGIIGCGTFSKSYAMTGWRLGYVVAPPRLADRVNRVHRTINGALNTFVQDAALAAFQLPAKFVDEMALAYQGRRDLVLNRLAEVPALTLAKPEGAFYAFPRVDSPYLSSELADLLATKGRVLVRAGSEYGPSGEGHLRISFATDVATLEEGLDRFVTTLAELHG